MSTIYREFVGAIEGGESMVQDKGRVYSSRGKFRGWSLRSLRAMHSQWSDDS